MFLLCYSSLQKFMIHLMDHIFPNTDSITNNDKAVAFRFCGAAEPEVLQHIPTPQACKTGLEPQENELHIKLTVGLLKNTIRLLSFL